MASADTQKLNNRRRRDHPRRETLPGGTVSRTHTRQLDFYQAMSDFKHMFPSMEEDVIEAILRANDGAVDATIDQLLTMSVDTDDISCVRKHTPLSKVPAASLKPENSLVRRTGKKDRQKVKRHTISGISPNSTKIQDSPPSYSEAMRLQHSSPLAGSHGATLPMTWRHSSLQQLPPTPPRGPHKRSLSACGNLLDIDLPNLSLSPNLSLPSSNTIPKTFYGHPNKPISTPSGRVYRNWNPPMLGTLPDDFLRLNLPIRLQRNSTPPPPPPPLSHKHSSPTRSLDANLNSTPQRKSYRPSKTMIISTHEFSKSMLEQKLKENERRRRSTSQDIDPELTQYLADEHLAIVIQNSEFLQELRGNEDFMKTLEKDIEGYGHDNQETLEAFPFSQPLPSSSVDEDAELRSQLKHMGRASRKQFVTLARKFFSRRKKKSSRDILGEKIAPSMTNLLEDEEQPEDDLPAAFLEDRPVFEPLPDTLPMNRTNQRFSQAMSNHTLNRRSDIV
ncbi:domain-containing 1-like [Octopus vulgaris]|uniref:Domain-containing 1-like n=1 Tax=Octopus vulgaris TaxID=6645 RepID=A0AA36EXN9_OCTVU|nr:domain-containing 1-like [Octopus vulgaris]